MKNSNKVLFGGIGLILLISVISIALTRVNTKVWSPEECDAAERKTKTLELAFDHIDVMQNIEVTLAQGEYKVEIDATAALMSQVMHPLEGNTLKLYIEDGGYDPCPVKVKITAPDLKGIYASNGASILCVDNFSASKLTARCVNGSSMDLHLTSNIVHVTAQNSANVNMKGKIKKLNATAQNSAQIKAIDAEVGSASFTLMNSAFASVHSDTITSAHLVNSASLHYFGEPILQDIQSQNSSSVNQVNEK